MIKVIETNAEYNTYSQDGLKSGETVFVKEDESVHFLTNNINGRTETINAYVGGGGTTVQADWAQTDAAEPDYIKNKPTIPTETSDLINDSGFVASNINNFEIEVTKQAPESYEDVRIVLNGGVLYVLKHDYEQDYLTVTAKETGNLVLKIDSGISTSNITSFSYSTDNGDNWTAVNNVDEQEVSATIPVTTGDKVLLKGEAVNWGDARLFEDTEIEFDVEGNVVSLFAGNNFYHYDSFENKQCIIRELFYDSPVVNAKNLSLPTNLIGLASFEGLFTYCSNLVTAPELPATTLAERCYAEMFHGCTALTTAPALPATTLANTCYRNMFDGCSALTTAPALPATTLANGCYIGMFTGCSLLTTAPALPATTLADECYKEMFYSCSALVNAPELPATTLVGGCYYNMFVFCHALTTAPTLPAATLTPYCYTQMFHGCENLNNITMLATDISAEDCLHGWVNSVSATGTFTKDANTEIPTGTNGIPEGWTVINQ